GGLDDVDVDDEDEVGVFRALERDDVEGLDPRVHVGVQVADVELFDGLDDVPAADDLAEDGEAAVLEVEPEFLAALYIAAVIVEVEEELVGGAVRVAAQLGHGDGALLV